MESFASVEDPSFGGRWDLSQDCFWR